MNWVRKSFVHLLALLLLVTLLVGAIATSLVLNFQKPDHIKTWLTESRLYDHFVLSIVEQPNGNSTANNFAPSYGGVSVNDDAVQVAAQTAFSQKLLQMDVNSFLDSNYSWLRGKTKSPDFMINLTAPKQQFATLVAQAVQAHLSSIAPCTNAELSQLNNSFDPLQVPCLPPTVSPSNQAELIRQQIADSPSFLSNPIITADNIDPNGANKPYYQKLSFMPQAYRLGLIAPYILAGLALLLILGITFIHPLRLKGVRRVGIVLFISGALLVVAKFVADFALTNIESKIFNGANIGQLQKALTDFAERAESALLAINLYIGVAFMVIALLIFIRLKGMHHAQTPLNIKKSRKVAPETITSSSELSKPKQRRQSAVMDVMPTAKTPGAALKQKSNVNKLQPLGKNPPKKRPGLVQ